MMGERLGLFVGMFFYCEARVLFSLPSVIFCC